MLTYLVYPTVTRYTVRFDRTRSIYKYV